MAPLVYIQNLCNPAHPLTIPPYLCHCSPELYSSNCKFPEKAIGIILKQDSYGQDLRDSLKEIDKCVQNLKDEAEICNARRSLLQGNIISGLSEQVDTQGAVLQAVYKLLCDDLIRRERISGKQALTPLTPNLFFLSLYYSCSLISKRRKFKHNSYSRVTASKAWV